MKYGADKKIRTSDLRITNAPLYQLSYAGTEGRQVYSNQHPATTAMSFGIYLHLVQPLLTAPDHGMRYRVPPVYRENDS